MFYILYVVLLYTLVCTITTAVTKGKSVNLNLETVLEFDNKNLDSDVKIIDNVQKFLSKVRNVLDNSKSKNYRRSFNKDKQFRQSMKFTDFLEQVINHLLTYNDEELEEIAVIIYEEIRKYHYKGCKFYELVENNEFRNFVADTLEEMKKLRGKYVILIRHKHKHGRPQDELKKMKKLLKDSVKILQDRDFQQKDLELVEYVNSLYRADTKEKMNTVIANFEDFRGHSRRTHTNLVQLIRKCIRSMIFDHYSNLNENARRDLRMKIASYFNEFIPENGRKGKGRTINDGTITKIEHRDTNQSVKVKDNRRKQGKRPRSHKGKGRKTTEESVSLLPTPDRDLEEEKNRMPFKFISLYAEEMPTTTPKKLKTSKKKKSKSHKHRDKKSDLKVPNNYWERPKTKAKKVWKKHPKTMMVVKEGRPLREILTEHNAVIRVISSRPPKHARVKGLNRALRKIKQHREAKLNKSRLATKETLDALEAESTTQKEKLINLFVTETYSQSLFPSNIEVTPLKGPLASDIKDIGPSRERETSDGEDSSREKLQKDKSSENYNKNKFKHDASDVEKTEMDTDVEDDTKDKSSASDVEHTSQTSKQANSDVDDTSEKSKQYESDAEIPSPINKRAVNSDVEDITPDSEYKPKKPTVEYTGLKNQKRKSFLDNGLAIESFESNVLDEHYVFRKNNLNDTFKSNKRSLLSKRSKKARAHDTRYRKKLLAASDISKSEERQKVMKVNKKSPKLKMVTKKVSVVSVQKHIQKQHKHFIVGKRHKHLTEKKLNNNTKKDYKAKPRFRSQPSDEKIENSTITYVSDNYLINKIHNLEKKLEVVINKMDNRNVKGEVRQIPKIYNSIETTLMYPLIPYWTGTLKTTRPYWSSSASSEENANDNDTISKSNEKMSANVSESFRADTIEHTNKTGNNALIQFKSKDQNLADVQINNNKTIKQGNETINDTKVATDDKLKQTKPDGRKQGILNIDNIEEITTKKYSIEDEKSHNVSMKSSVENTHTTKSYNKSNTAKNYNSTKNATSTTKHDKLDKVLKEHSVKGTKSTKKDKYFRSAVESPNEDLKPLKKDKSEKDKSKKDKREKNKSGLTYTTKNKETLSKDTESTKKDKYYRAAMESPNEDSKPLKKAKSGKEKLGKDESGLTNTSKNKERELSSKSSQLTTTCTTTTKAGEIDTTTNENLSKQTEMNSSKISATKDEIQTDRALLLNKNTTSTHSGSDSTTMSAEILVKFTFSNANMNISSAKNDNEEKSDRKTRRSPIYLSLNPFAISNEADLKSKREEADLKSKREMDETLYNWA